ncbi:MAG TPA: ATP-binding protein [Gaiellaceae bacterium]|nr:ATP-binding protein [Gaiellaceae bacterium]
MARAQSADLFPTDLPLPASLLIGRADDVREIATTLMAGAHLVVAGPRRTGKTSVCEAALARAKNGGYYVAALDLFRIANTAQFAEALVSATIANRPRLHRILHRAREAGRLVADAAGTTVVLKAQDELGDELEIAFKPGLADRDPERYLDYALGLPQRIAEQDGKHVILFIDEFQEVANPRKPYGDPDGLTKRMRATFQRSRDVSFLFAGSYEHILRDLFGQARQAFAHFGSLYELRPISGDAWRKGLLDRFAADACAVDTDALDRLLELGGGHPRATMLLAQKTHLQAILAGSHHIDATLVEQGVRSALLGDRATLGQTVEQIRLGHRHALLIARRIALDESPYRDLKSVEAFRALKGLQQAGLIVQDGPRRWRILDPLLARYLRELEPYA